VQVFKIIKHFSGENNNKWEIQQVGNHLFLKKFSIDAGNQAEYNIRRQKRYQFKQ